MTAWAINRESVSSDFLEGEVVAIHLGTGIYYSLRGTAAVLWQTLAQPQDAGQLAAALAAQFVVAPAEAETDVAAFLARLQSEGLVRPADPSPAAPGRAAVPVRQPYVPPALERFADLQDLLLLDPIHDVGAQGWPHRPAPDEKK